LNMALRIETLPSDPALLRELALALDAENESLRTRAVQRSLLSL
jgi:hypothetical protein